MRVHQQPALVLHQRDYSETSLLLEVFTANHGRIGLIAKGARRASSRLRGVLKQFQPLLIGWGGKGGVALRAAAGTGERGYGLVLDQHIEDKTPIDTRAMYDYILDRGPMRLAYPELNRPTEGVQIRGSSLLALAQESLSDPVALRDAKALMRAALARHLGDRPLHSRKLFRRVVPLSAMETAMETGLDKAGR